MCSKLRRINPSKVSAPFGNMIRRFGHDGLTFAVIDDVALFGTKLPALSLTFCQGSQGRAQIIRFTVAEVITYSYERSGPR